MKDWKILLLLLLIVFVAGCAGTDVEGKAPLAAVTITALPSATQVTPPTDTPEPSPTATVTATSTPQPTATLSPTPTITPTAAPVTLIGAGDIALCGEEHTGDEQTAAILGRFPDATIFTAGDNVYGDGTAAEFRSCFTPSWGQFRDRMRPVPGNHDYHTNSASPYYEYFGEAAGEPGKGFYSYDLGDWHIIALNSNCNDISCREGSAQVDWLRAELQNSDKRCQMIYWHHPLFTSGPSGNYGSARTFWKVAYEFGVDVVVNGHEHSYERFAPQDPTGVADPNGIREFVVGTGGAYLRDWATLQPNSEARNNTDHGVIKFNLFPDRYEWEFVPVEGATFTDSGTEACH